MAASATLLPMAHERKVENLRAFMVNLANSRGFSLPETKLFEQKLLDLCLSRTPDHPTYSAMIFVAIMDLNEEGGSCEEAISEFIKSKYKNLPFAHTSLLSHHLAKLVEKREVLCDCNNYCYSLPGEKKNTVVSTDAGRTSAVITAGSNDQRAANEVMTLQSEEECVEIFNSVDHKVDLVEEQSLTESRTSLQREAFCAVNVIEVRHGEDNGVKAGLRDSTVETSRKEGVAGEPEVALENNETEGKIEANCEEGELYQVGVLYEPDDVLIEESGEEVMGTSSKQRKAKLCRTSNTMKEACAEAKSEAYKKLWKCQTEACDNIIALEKMLKQCKENDQADSEINVVSCLPLSMESCRKLWKVAQKIQSQLSEIIDTRDETVVPYSESPGGEIEGTSKGFCKEDPKMKRSCGINGSGKTSKQLEQERRDNCSQKKPLVKKTRMKRLRDIGTTAVRKSPRLRL